MPSNSEATLKALVPTPAPDNFTTITNVNGDNLAYVFQSTPVNIDMADAQFITVLPEVTTAAGGGAVNVIWKMQWSIDATNWIDDFVDSTNYLTDTWAVAASGERSIVSTGFKTRTFPIAVAVKGAVLKACALAVPRVARYCRIGQRVDVQITVGSQICKYHFTTF